MAARKPERPAGVKVGPFLWRIQFVDGIDEHGLTEPYSSVISVRENLPGDLERETMFHELLHAVLFAQGVRVDKHEKWVQRISPLLYLALREDEQLRRYLFG